MKHTHRFPKEDLSQFVLGILTLSLDNNVDCCGKIQTLEMSGLSGQNEEKED